MKELTVKNIIEACNAKLLSGNINATITTFSKDTRTLTPGDIYIGIKGENFDGNVFGKSALASGAIGFITDAPVEESILMDYPDKIIIQVQNSITALQQLANYKRKL